MISFKVFLAFLKRDWRIRRSYRMSLFTQVGHLLFAIASCFFIGKLIDPQHAPALAAYGGAYFPFALFGITASRYLGMSLSSIGGGLREEQLQGTLEAVLATPTKLTTLVMGTVASEMLWVTVEIGLAFGIGAWLFGLEMSRCNLLATLVMGALTVACLGAVGVVCACGILLFKEFDPVSWALDGLMRLTSGVYFPVGLLPHGLQAVAAWLPLTYALEGLRQAALMGRSLRELSALCVTLGMMSLAAWPLALTALSWTIRRLKITGALSFR